MKAIEFETELTDHTIQIPEGFQLELSQSGDKHVRVIVLMDDLDKSEDVGFKDVVRDQFLKGYDEIDSVYDDL